MTREDIAELFDERAGIYQFMAGHSLMDSEIEARLYVFQAWSTGRIEGWDWPDIEQVLTERMSVEAH